VEEGEQLLKVLAHHPSTARFISTKLARRFIADDPPEAVVTAASRTFMQTGGDIREVLRTILASPPIPFAGGLPRQDQEAARAGRERPLGRLTRTLVMASGRYCQVRLRGCF
jgi:hypothetical protein